MKSLIPRVIWRELLPAQRSVLCVADLSSGIVSEVWSSNEVLIEAPNWVSATEQFLINSAGTLYLIDASLGSTLIPIATPGFSDWNNDHLVSHDGQTIYASSEGTGHIYRFPITGGMPERLTEELDGVFSAFLQGLSSDGTTLAFTGAKPGGDFAISDLYTIDLSTGCQKRETYHDGDVIGFEFDRKNEWWYFNFNDSGAKGNSQIFRMTPDGNTIEKLTDNEKVNWFPKLSPEGDRLIYLSYSRGTIGHEANAYVSIHLMDCVGGDREILNFFGGQGTLNVNSWNRAGTAFAFIMYPLPGSTFINNIRLMQES